MKISDAGIDLIKSFEGLRLDAYPDPGTGGEPFTIGYGHTGGVSLSDRITTEDADAFLRADLEKFEQCVSGFIGAGVEVTQSEFDALVSLAFNIGCNALRGSTLMRRLNGGDYGGAAEEFLRWNRSGGKVMAGLTRRRKAERELFLS